MWNTAVKPMLVPTLETRRCYCNRSAILKCVQLLRPRMLGFTGYVSPCEGHAPGAGEAHTAHVPPRGHLNGPPAHTSIPVKSGSFLCTALRRALQVRRYCLWFPSLLYTIYTHTLYVQSVRRVVVQMPSSEPPSHPTQGQRERERERACSFLLIGPLIWPPGYKVYFSSFPYGRSVKPSLHISNMRAQVFM